MLCFRVSFINATFNCRLYMFTIRLEFSLLLFRSSIKLSQLQTQPFSQRNGSKEMNGKEKLGTRQIRYEYIANITTDHGVLRGRCMLWKQLSKLCFAVQWIMTIQRDFCMILKICTTLMTTYRFALYNILRILWN